MNVWVSRYSPVTLLNTVVPLNCTLISSKIYKRRFQGKETPSGKAFLALLVNWNPISIFELFQSIYADGETVNANVNCSPLRSPLTKWEDSIILVDKDWVCVSIPILLLKRLYLSSSFWE